MMTDRLYHDGAFKSAKLQSKFSPTYFYYFRFITKTGIAPTLNENSLSKNSLESNEVNPFLGVSHGDDVFLIYYNPSSRGPLGIPYDDNEKRVSHQLVGLYKNFAAENNAAYGNKTITSVEPDKVECLEIFSPQNFSMQIKDEEFGHQKFWDALNIQE